MLPPLLLPPRARDFYGVRFFSSLNIIIPPRWRNTIDAFCSQRASEWEQQRQLIPNFSLIVVSVDVSLSLSFSHPSTISAVFISILLLFNQLLILSAVHTTFCFFFPLFRRRNHSPIFILSSFVCEQRPQKVALGLSLAGLFFLLSALGWILTDFASVQKTKIEQENFLA